MKISYAAAHDLETLSALDRHIGEKELQSVISLKRVYVAEAGGELAGWLRYGLFWDNTPFMNMLYILEPHRGKGFGRALVQYWEDEMRQAGFGCVMTSAVSGENAQHFYTRLGYREAGGFTPPGDPYELIFIKEL